MTAQPYDHRNSEYSLQAAVTYAVHHDALGRRAMILHGKRAGGLPDIALLTEARALNLIELKRQVKSETDALAMLAQIACYVVEYRALSLGTLATWYCHAMIESMCGLSFRGDAKTRLEERGDQMFHIIERFDKTQVKEYRDASGDPDAACAKLARDFERRFDRAAELAADDRLEVPGVVLVAESWSDAAMRVVASTIRAGFDRGRLEKSTSHKYIAKVLAEPEAFAAIRTLDVDVRRVAPSTWLVPVPAESSS